MGWSERVNEWVNGEKKNDLRAKMLQSSFFCQALHDGNESSRSFFFIPFCQQNDDDEEEEDDDGDDGEN